MWKSIHIGYQKEIQREAHMPFVLEVWEETWD